jgi:hypothetical protein
LVERSGAENLRFVGEREFARALGWGTRVDLRLPCVVRGKKGHPRRAADVAAVNDPLASLTQQRNEARPAWRLTQNLLLRPTPLPSAHPRKPTQPVTVRFGARPVRRVGQEEPRCLGYGQRGRGGRRRRDGAPGRWETNLPRETYAAVWRVVEADAARWPIEQMIRLSQAELGSASIRVRAWKPRARLWAIISRAYAFLAHLRAAPSSLLVAALRGILQRTGQQANAAWRPLDRFRPALAAVWKHHPRLSRGPLKSRGVSCLRTMP